MPRAIWQGSLGFGMAHIPVKLYTATREHDIKFKRWDSEAEEYPRQVQMVGDREIPVRDLSRVYEFFSPREYHEPAVSVPTRVEITDADLESVRPASRRHMQIQEFVPLDTVDPLYIEKSYFLGPGHNGEYAYTLLARALKEEKAAGIVKVLMRTKEHLGMVYMNRNALCLSTLMYVDEIVGDNMLHYERAGVADEDVETACQLVASRMSATYDPYRYNDDHHHRTLDMIYAKAGETGEVFVPEEVPARPRADIMDLIRADIEERTAA